jgi:hypothetical protein
MEATMDWTLEIRMIFCSGNNLESDNLRFSSQCLKLTLS